MTHRFSLAGLVIACALLVMVPAAQSGTPTCLGKPVTQAAGTNGDDDLSGTSGDDVIVGLGGNDTIDGKGGNDRICGGGGKDQIDAGSGKDQVKGDDGADKINVADGEADQADGGGGADTCKADSSDTVKSCVVEAKPQCADGVDNDNDGKVDTNDPGCSDSSDNSESPDPAKPQCADGIDNDNDGKVDTADPGCSAATDDSESPDPTTTTQCSDGVDNDNDGKVDTADPGCSDASDDSESPDPGGSANLVVRDSLDSPQIDDSGNPYYPYETFLGNSGPDSALPPKVTIKVPANFTVRSVYSSISGVESNGDPAECGQSGTTVTCSFFSQWPPTSPEYQVVVLGVFTSAAGGTFTAEVSSSTPDPDSSDNSVSTTATPAQCANGVDDDSDGQTDYPADTNCGSASGTES